MYDCQRKPSHITNINPFLALSRWTVWVVTCWFILAISYSTQVFAQSSIQSPVQSTIPEGLSQQAKQKILYPDPAVKVYDLAPYFTVIEDTSNQLTFQEIRDTDDKAFKTITQKDFNGGYSNSTFWLKLVVYNNANNKQILSPHYWALELSYAALDFVDFYIPKGEKYIKIQAGDQLPVSVQQSSSNFPSAYFELPTDQIIQIYIRVQTSSSLQLPVKLWTPLALHEHQAFQRLIYGMYFGLLLIMALYNLFLFFSLGEKSYFYYVLYIVTFGLLQASIYGITVQYLWPQAIRWANISIPFLIAAASYFAIQFARYFLNTPKTSRRTDSVLIIIAALCSVLIISSLFISYRLALTAGNILTLVITGALIGAGIIATVRRYPGAVYFLLGWAALLLGSSIFMGLSIGVLTRNWFTEHAALYGSAAECLLLALALGERIKTLQSERNAAESQARQDLQASNCELSVSLAELEKSKELKDYFLAKVSHELRTPLNGISGSLELLRMEDLPSQQDQYASAAQTSADHMLHLVNTLLQFSEAQAETPKSSMLVDLRQILENTLNNHHGRLHSKGLHSHITIDPGIPPILHADADSIHLILSNLLDNAILFTEQGHIEINVKANKLSVSGCEIEFEFKDSGQGIKGNDLETIFDPFYQAGGKQNNGRLGIGLAVCRQLVNRMRGRIWAEPCEQGACIKFILPMDIDLQLAHIHDPKNRAN